jgi:DNA-binding transcriptional LysR family regulator
LRSKQLKVRERFEMDALDAIAALVNRALGVAVVPDWAPPWLERLDLQKVPLDGFTERREVGVLWNQASPRIAFVRTFLRACTEEHPG